MFGFKIFDNDPQDKIREILHFANEENLTIEIALYNTEEDTKNFKQFLLNNADYFNIKNKSIHLDYKKYTGNEINNENIHHFINELTISEDLGITQAVLHFQEPSTFKTHLFNLDSEQLKNHLLNIYNIVKNYHIHIYIENTFIYKRKSEYNDLTFHRRIWDTIIELNLQDKIGMCLDWGHVKAFANDDLEDWLLYVKEIRTQGVQIYMHIHDNDSIKDLHETLHNGKRRGFDKLAGNKPFLELLDKYHSDFTDESLILEYRSEFAIEAYLEIKNEFNK